MPSKAETIQGLAGSLPTTLEELLDLVERDFPPSMGYSWLLRSDEHRRGTYFANIIRFQAAVRYPVYKPSRFEAMLGAYMLALRGEA